MHIIFNTTSTQKYQEAKAVFHSPVSLLAQLKYETPELQADGPEIVSQKLQFALKSLLDCKMPLFVEDTSLEITALNGAPGPYIKYFWNTVGSERLVKMIEAFPDKSAKMVCHVAFYDKKDSHLFHTSVTGTIVKPVGDNGFGWDDIFRPYGSDLTFAEMGNDEKMKFSARTHAFTYLKSILCPCPEDIDKETNQ